MKKIIISVVLMFCILSVPAMAINPYDLKGNGNCAYFAWEIMDMYYPVSFKVSGQYNAKDWIGLDGQQKDKYRLELFNDPQVGDFVIFAANIPGQSGWRGHVAFVEGVEEKVSVNFFTRQVQKETWINVIESNDYANKKYYPYAYEDCFFRYNRILIDRDGMSVFGENEVKFLRLVEGET